MYLFCSIGRSLSFPGASAYHSLMIEVNKRCYMNEETLEKTSNFTNLHNQSQRLKRARTWLQEPSHPPFRHKKRHP